LEPPWALHDTLAVFGLKILDLVVFGFKIWVSFIVIYNLCTTGSTVNILFGQMIPTICVK